MEEDIKLLLSYIETEVKEGKKPLIGGGVIVNGTAILKLLDRVRAALEVATGEDKVKEARQNLSTKTSPREKREPKRIA